MSKYYTPTIEEFHVGFSFEDSTNDKEADWVQWYIADRHELAQALDILELHNCRVKRLDREDIESLGYVLHREDVTMGYDEYCHKRHKEVLPPGNDSRLNVILKKGNNVIVYKNLEIVFKGTIKNKSELKKILKQLGI